MGQLGIGLATFKEPVAKMLPLPNGTALLEASGLVFSTKSVMALTRSQGMRQVRTSYSSVCGDSTTDRDSKTLSYDVTSDYYHH